MIKEESPTLAHQATVARQAFFRKFGREAEIVAYAPGRVNLIGEHTDYNGGFVLPMALDRRTIFAGAPNHAQRACIHVPAFKDEVSFSTHTLPSRGKPSWANYSKGVLAGFLGRGASVPGFDAVILSNVPLGGGLSSSAALEVSTGMFLQSLTGLTLAPEEMAQLCQKAEHDYAGVPCGVMDQFVSRCAREGCALLLDCQSLEARHIPFADQNVRVLIVNSMVKHALADGAYAQRRSACELAARTLSIPSLRAANFELLEKHRGTLDETTYRMARHVIGEIQRTQTAAEYLLSGDWEKLGSLMYQSHASLRDDYEVSCPELDLLVQIASACPGVYGARMTGGGFGGCIVALARTELVEKAAQEIAAQYEAKTGRIPQVLISPPSAGAGIVG